MKKSNNNFNKVVVKTKDIKLEDNKKVDFKEKFKNISKKNNIKLIRLMLFLLFTYICLFIIGYHSTYLIKTVIKWFLLLLSIISFGILILLIIIFINNKDKTKLKWTRWIYDGFTYIYVVGVTVFLVILYGPDYGFRDWLISTAMRTMNHKYICQIFYNEKEIQESLGRNYLVEPDGETDISLIHKAELVTYKNKYEEEILSRKNNQDYKMIKFKVNGQQAYLAVIYDPSRVFVGVSKNIGRTGEYVTKMSSRYGAKVAVNGGNFVDLKHVGTGGEPIGVTISKGKVYSDEAYSNHGLVGFNEDDVLVLYKNKSANEAKKLGIRDCVTAKPFLIVNGKAAITKGNGGWGYAARTAIGQREDGIVLLLVVDSNETRTKGASMKDLTDIMLRYGAINASALDGGTSSVMVENSKLISDPIDGSFNHRTRPIATSILFK